MRPFQIYHWIVSIVVLAAALVASDANAQEHRINSGLILLFDFEDVKDGIIRDRSGLTPQLDVAIQNKNGVETKDGAIELKSDTAIKSNEITPRIAATIIRFGQVTLEAWIHPANVSQKGPARILTYSRNSNDRSFTIGQDGNKFVDSIRV